MHDENQQIDKKALKREILQELMAMMDNDMTAPMLPEQGEQPSVEIQIEEQPQEGEMPEMASEEQPEMDPSEEQPSEELPPMEDEDDEFSQLVEKKSKKKLSEESSS